MLVVLQEDDVLRISAPNSEKTYKYGYKVPLNNFYIHHVDVTPLRKHTLQAFTSHTLNLSNPSKTLPLHLFVIIFQELANDR
jgi:hypothetical protein